MFNFVVGLIIAVIFVIVMAHHLYLRHKRKCRDCINWDKTGEKEDFSYGECFEDYKLLAPETGLGKMEEEMFEVPGKLIEEVLCVDEKSDV